MHASLRSCLGLVFGLLAGSAALATDGDFDPGFGTDATAPGFGFYPTQYNPGGLDRGSAVGSTHDGKLILAGFVGGDGGRFVVQHTDANGYPDYDFGTAGLRTYVRPCNNGIFSAAKVDAQERLWLTPDGCGKFTVYRFKANGDLDTSLLGSGVLNLSFDRGTHSDSVDELLFLPDGGFILAGKSAGDTKHDLALAAFDVNGNPDLDFGTGGKLIVSLPYDLYRVSGFHRMDDGRLVIDGILLDDDHDENFVVRLQPDGQKDAAFGISNPGISRYDFRPANHLNATISPVRSWLETDGSLVQAGTGNYAAFPNSRFDVTITRWRADGSLDTSVGTAGTRRYPLDLAGDNPVNVDDNKELAVSFLREGNGRWLVSYYAFRPVGRSCFGVLRLKRDFSADPSFGDNGRTCANLDVSGTSFSYFAYDLIEQPGRIVMVGSAGVGAGGGNLPSMVGLENDLLFGDTFD